MVANAVWGTGSIGTGQCVLIARLNVMETSVKLVSLEEGVYRSTKIKKYHGTMYNL